MKKLLLAAAAAGALALGLASPASAFDGPWYYDNNPGGWEVLHLGDSSDDTVLVLGGTELYCGRPGASYARIRQILNATGGDYVTWWVDEDCGDYVRICVQNWSGERACSTYWYGGWEYVGG